MLKARREACQRVAHGQGPRYAQASSRTRYRERNQGNLSDRYNLQEDQYGCFEQQQFQQSQFAQHQSLQQQFDTIYQYGQHNGHQYGLPNPPWPQNDQTLGGLLVFRLNLPSSSQFHYHTIGQVLLIKSQFRKARPTAKRSYRWIRGLCPVFRCRESTAQAILCPTSFTILHCDFNLYLR